MNEKLSKEVKFLKIYSFVITALLLTLFYLVLQPQTNNSLEELTVERINVVEKNGDLKLVISNSERQHNGIINGAVLPERERPAGLIFFNSFGDECGGLVYDGNENEAGMVLSVDKFRDDQVMQVQYMENTKNKKRKYGLQLWDYPQENSVEARNKRYKEIQNIQDKEAVKKAYAQMKEEGLVAENRLFLGKNFNKDVGLFINDEKGNPRIKLYIDEANTAKLEFLDEKGEPVQGGATN
ncbi:hypothetical protein AAG747_27845 [Rapidithrix thailandica]|uniref:Uncharacterized protein n=1 Tax=Rapidithrix thailandica TaxID=413964 RepID=A0AAW9SGM7_9BACT